MFGRVNRKAEEAGFLVYDKTLQFTLSFPNIDVWVENNNWEKIVGIRTLMRF
jgi:hypothetical protein